MTIFGKIGSKILQKRMQNYLNQLFLYRSHILVNDLFLEKIIQEKGKRILISGSHGLIGSSLIPLLTSIVRHKISRLVRKENNNNMDLLPETNKEDKKNIFCDLQYNKLYHYEQDELNIIINHAGENIFGRWTDTKKQRIYDSRVGSTKLLSESLTKLSHPPSLLICASAIGYYGDRPNEYLP